MHSSQDRASGITNPSYSAYSVLTTFSVALLIPGNNQSISTQMFTLISSLIIDQLKFVNNGIVNIVTVHRIPFSFCLQLTTWSMCRPAATTEANYTLSTVQPQHSRSSVQTNPSQFSIKAFRIHFMHTTNLSHTPPLASVYLYSSSSRAQQSNGLVFDFCCCCCLWIWLKLSITLCPFH